MLHKTDSKAQHPVDKAMQPLKEALRRLKEQQKAAGVAFLMMSSAACSAAEEGTGTLNLMATRHGQPAMTAVNWTLDGKSLDTRHQQSIKVEVGDRTVCINPNRCRTVTVMSGKTTSITMEIDHDT